jgi:transposase-like protein
MTGGLGALPGGQLGHFADELSAHRYLEKILWPDGVVACPRCGDRDRLGKLNGETIRLGTYKCYACRRSFSITHGTLFASSHVPLHKWLQAIYLTDGGTAPIRPYHLCKILNVSSRTASAMLQRLREGTATSPQVSARPVWPIREAQLAEIARQAPDAQPTYASRRNQEA